MRVPTLSLVLLLLGPALSSPAAADSPAPDAISLETATDTERLAAFRTAFHGTTRGTGVDDWTALREQLPGVLAWREAARATHDATITAEGPGGPLALALAALDADLADYLQDRDAAFEASRARVETGLEKALVSSARAVALESPSMFNSVKSAFRGVSHHLKAAEAMLGSDDPRYQALLAQVDDVRATVARDQAILGAALAAGTLPPKDVYGGSDRQALEKQIREAWGQTWPDETILQIRFHNATWETNHKQVWDDDHWREVHMKYLYAKVIVDAGPELATMYVAVVNRDLTQGGDTSVGVRTRTGHWVVEPVLKENLGKSASGSARSR